MKNLRIPLILTILALPLLFMVLNNCSSPFEGTDPKYFYEQPVITSSGLAKVIAMVDIKGANNDVYFDFSTGDIETVPKGQAPTIEWDILFTSTLVNVMGSTDWIANIIVNEAQGVLFYKVDKPLGLVKEADTAEFKGPGFGGYTFPDGDIPLPELQLPYPNIGVVWYTSGGPGTPYDTLAKTIVIQTTEGHYAKFQVMNYYENQLDDYNANADINSGNFVSAVEYQYSEGPEFKDEVIVPPTHPCDIPIPDTYPRAIANVDANGANNDVYFDFSEGTATEVPNGDPAPAGNWDIKFTSDPESIVVNAAGNVEYYMVEQPIEFVTAVAEYELKGPGDLGYQPRSGGFAWWLAGRSPYPSIWSLWYNVANPDEVYNDMTFVIRTTEGSYAKFQMLNYYGGSGGSQAYVSTFKYWYLEDGCLMFPDIPEGSIPDTARCLWENAMGDPGKFNCRDMPVGMTEIAARKACEEDGLHVGAKLGTLEINQGLCQDRVGVTYTGSCDVGVDGKDYYEHGDCGDYQFSNRWGCGMLLGTFECLLP